MSLWQCQWYSLVFIDVAQAQKMCWNLHWRTQDFFQCGQIRLVICRTEVPPLCLVQGRSHGVVWVRSLQKLTTYFVNNAQVLCLYSVPVVPCYHVWTLRKRSQTTSFVRVGFYVLSGLNDRGIPIQYPRRPAKGFGKAIKLDGWSYWSGHWHMTFCFEMLCQLACMIYITNANARINILSITAEYMYKLPCCSQIIWGCFNASETSSRLGRGGIWATDFQKKLLKLLPPPTRCQI